MKLCNHLERRVVVTGLGIVSCLGTGIDYVWKRLINGDNGIVKINFPNNDKIPSKVAGLIKKGKELGELDMSKNIFNELKSMSMSLGSYYALVAADEAIKQSKINLDDTETSLKTGVCIGMSMPHLDDIIEMGNNLNKSYKKVNPFFIPNILTNMAAGLVSLKYGIKGLNHSVSTACATGLHSIGDAFRFIKHGDSDVIVCGGSESCIGELSMAGFCKMRALSTSFNEDPHLSSRPFDKNRDGFVISEGSGILVLEELDHAKKRKALILAEILGYGLSADANHITAPSKNGEGAKRCMERALLDAALGVSDIGYINAHATSTSLGDTAEAKAIYDLFKKDNQIYKSDYNHKLSMNFNLNNGLESEIIGFNDPFVSSTKGAVGHMLGAAGSIEAIFTVLSCLKNIIPPTVNLNVPDVGVDLNFVKGVCINWKNPEKKRVALTNSFGFGGTNGSLCIGEFVE